MAGSYNKILIIGNVGRDPEIRYTPSGDQVADFSVATSERRTVQGQQQEQTTWFRISAWGKLAEVCGQYVHKGSYLYIEGPLTQREATDREAFADALVENLARQDLTSKEVMEAVVALQDEYGWSIREIGRRTGRADGHLSRLIRVGRDPEVATLVAEEIIPPTTGYYIVDLVDPEVRREIVARVRSGVLRTGAEVQTAIAAALGRRARERAETRRTPPLPTPPAMPSATPTPGPEDTHAEQDRQADRAERATSSPPAPADDYGQVRLKTHPDASTGDDGDVSRVAPGLPPIGRPAEIIPDERIPVQAHTRRVGASSRAERLANYILAQVAQWGTLPLDYPSLERLAEARDALDRALEAHGHD